MKLRLFQVDAFTAELFHGNPAAVCPLERWLDDATMQAVAAENNLSETAFFVFGGDTFALRWFTPTTEVELCGHATLASAHVIFEHIDAAATVVRFSTCSGILEVARTGDGLVMNFPALPAEPCRAPEDLVRGLGRRPEQTLRAKSYLAVFDSERAVRALEPDFAALARLESFGVIATAPGDTADFVSRFFAPSFGVDEDPATGSAHCTLTPYWSRRLGKPRLRAFQASARGADLDCEDHGERVTIGGRCADYLEGTIEVPG